MDDAFFEVFPDHVCLPTCRPPVHIICLQETTGVFGYQRFAEYARSIGIELGEPVEGYGGRCECADDPATVQHFIAPAWALAPEDVHSWSLNPSPNPAAQPPSPAWLRRGTSAPSDSAC